MTDDPPGDTPRDGAPHGGAEVGWAALSTLLAGVFVWGGLGWLVDWWLGITLFLPIGLVGGLALATYSIMKRYG